MKYVFSIILILFFCQCAKQNNATIQLENGDFLLVSAGNSSLSGAIDRVTQTDKSTHYSHIAMLEKDGDKAYVLEATTGLGTVRRPLKTFVDSEKAENNRIFIYRLKEKYKESIPMAIIKAKTFLGKPYNFTYIQTDTAFYCSDFVQRSFGRDDIFKMNPMTFKDAKTGTTDSAWIKFYQKQNLEVPEGKPGCNPNGMASEKSVQLVGEWH